MRVLLFSTTETILLCAIFPFAQRIFSIVRRRGTCGRFLEKFESFRNFASQFPEKRLMGKNTSECCHQIGRAYEKSSPLCDLCRSRPGSGNLRLRTLIMFTGPYDHL
jgi:hypothetical protein